MLRLRGRAGHWSCPPRAGPVSVLASCLANVPVHQDSLSCCPPQPWPSLSPPAQLHLRGRDKNLRRSLTMSLRWCYSPHGQVHYGFKGVHPDRVDGVVSSPWGLSDFTLPSAQNHRAQLLQAALRLVPVRVPDLGQASQRCRPRAQPETSGLSH